MSDNGAHEGYNADQALKAVLGGEQPAGDELSSTRALAARLDALTENPGGYEGTADWAAKLIYQKDENGRSRFDVPPAQLGWSQRMKADGVPIYGLDLTGFMWGWAVNPARAVMELPAVPNPAIVTIGGNDA